MVIDNLKLQKQFDKKRETKRGTVEYHKFVFVIPPDIIRLLGWEDVDPEMEFEAEPDRRRNMLKIKMKRKEK